MQTIERLMLTALLRDMRRAGYEPAAVWDGEEYVCARSANAADGVKSFPARAPKKIHRALTDEEALEAIDSVDESTLHFTQRNAREWGNRGVLLILGNGQDVMSDHHCADGEPFGEIISAIWDKVQDGKLP